MTSSIIPLEKAAIFLPISSKRFLDKTKSTFQISKFGFLGPKLTSQSFCRIQYISHVSQPCSSSLMRCAASLNARCAAEQTQTVKHKSSTVMNAPTQVKEKSPKLDDGGTGAPPPGDGGGGGGGGGGGPSSSGGFFLFAVLLFLSYLREKENERDNDDPRRSYNRIY